MPMVPFYTRFPQLAWDEMRTVAVLEGGELPPGQFGFLEMYCDEEGCDCRRVAIRVVSAPPEAKVYANISYGWEPEAFYQSWGGASDGVSLKGPDLDPLNVQTRYAPAFLKLFRDVVLEDQAYIDRLARHYAMFKGTCGQQPTTGRAGRAARRAERNLKKRR